MRRQRGAIPVVRVRQLRGLAVVEVAIQADREAVLLRADRVLSLWCTWVGLGGAPVRPGEVVECRAVDGPAVYGPAVE